MLDGVSVVSAVRRTAARTMAVMATTTAPATRAIRENKV